MKEDRRKYVRVQTPNGLAILRAGGSAPIACKLTNLSESGCRVLIEAKDAGIWERVNKPSQMLELLLSSEPHLDRFVVSAEVRNVLPSGVSQDIQLGLQFRPLEPKRAGVLRLALLKLATERLRTAPPANRAPNPGDTQAVQPLSSPSPRKTAFLYKPDTATIQVRPAELSASPQKRPGSKTEVLKPLSGVTQSAWQDPFYGKRIGEVLVRMGKLTQSQVDAALDEARNWRERFGQYLVKRGLVSSAELCRALALATGIPTTDLSQTSIRRTFREIFPIETMKRYEFIPFDANSKVVCIATGSPFPEPVLAEIRSLTGKRVEVFLAEEHLVLQLIDKTQEESASESGLTKNRRFPRLTMSLPATYYFCTSSGEPLETAVYNGHTINLSEGGFRIEGPHTTFGRMENVHAYGLYVHLSVKFPPHEFSALCKPVYIYEKETIEIVELPFEMGLSIIELSPPSKQALQEVIEIVKKLTKPTSV